MSDKVHLTIILPSKQRGQARVGRDGTVLFGRKQLEWVRRGECLIVTSHRPDFKGYIAFDLDGIRTRLHRYICERRHGPLGPLVARHTCDNPACINPDHIIPGTAKQNSDDMVARGRSMRGERSHTAKLTAQQVLEIRASQASDSEVRKAIRRILESCGRHTKAAILETSSRGVAREEGSMRLARASAD